MAGTSLRSGLDRDVYQIVKKLEDERQAESSSRDRPGKKPPAKLTLTAIYESIKKSNSSLSRQKRKPLEDAIDRVLAFRKQEEAAAEDSDDLLEAAEEAEAAYKAENQFLLNRQMTKHWNVAPVAPAPAVTAQGPEGKSTKKRRLSTEPEASVAKKMAKPSKYGPEQIAPGLDVLVGADDHLLELNMFVFGPAEKPLAFTNKSAIGTIISGPPGTGKQSLVRMLSSVTSTPLISLGRHLADNSSPEKVSKIITDVLDEARKYDRCIVLIEHLDEFMAKSGNHHNEYDSKVITQLKQNFQRMKKWDSEEGHGRVKIVATTSKLESIDHSLRTPKYFGQIITVNVPDADAREEIFRLFASHEKVASGIDFKSLAIRTHGFVGDDIQAVVMSAGQKATRRFFHADLTRARHTLGATKMDMETSSKDPHPWNRSLEEAGLWHNFVNHPSYTEPQPLVITEQDLLDAIARHTPYLRREGFSSVPSTTWSEVGALHDVRKALNLTIVRRIKEPHFFQKFGKQRPYGVLLYGPPGCGKTLVAKAVANDAQASFILVKGPELLNKYVGESERAIRELFARAKASAPCILFFDEMDSLVPKRENTTTEAGARVVNALLAELDGADDRGDVYVIGTSNRPDMIDPAILRPGRLDKLLFIDLPTEDERVDILGTIVGNGMGGMTAEEIERVARDPRCHGFSGADLYGLYKTALDECAERWTDGEPLFTSEDWETALNERKPSVANPETYRELAAVLHHQT